MSNTLTFNNFDSPNIITQTKLTADAAAASNSLTVNNSANFVNNGWVLVGGLGEVTSEMQQISTPISATAIPLQSTTSLAHNFEDYVTLLFGNQIKVYRADDQYASSNPGQQPDDDNFDLVAGGTIAITANSPITEFTDASGVVGQWYKYTFYDASTNSETQLSDSEATQAGVTHYVSLDVVRAAAGFRNNPKVTDEVITRHRNAAEREINGALTALYTFPLPEPTNPIVVNIAKEIAAGELIQEEYAEVNPQMVATGEARAKHARNGGGSITSLDELRMRDVVLEDANYNELVTETGHGVSGWPDDTTQVITTVTGDPMRNSPPAGMDYGPQATIDEVF